MTQPTEGSLFSGYGGLSLAVSAVYGARTIWTSDIDKGANKILAHRFGDVPNLGDISTVDWATVERPNILSGGFPCQDVSSAGKRAGLVAGTRSGLWSEFARAIDALHPDLVVIENVRGLTSAKSTDSIVEPCDWCMGDGPSPHMRALGTVLGDLADLGYDAQWAGLRAADVGAPHGRFRIFITAHPRGLPGLAGGVAASRQAQGGRALRKPSGRDRASALALLPTPVTRDESEGTPGDLNRHSPKLAAVEAHFPTPRATRGGSATETFDLLPTPNAADGDGTGRHNSVGHQDTLPGTVRLLPTPNVGASRVSDSAGEMKRKSPSIGAIASLLPTPSVADGTGGHATRGGERSDEILLGGIADLLPTPRATDGSNGGPNQRGSSGDLMLPSAVHLLPTPRSQNGEERNQNIWQRPLDQPQNLENALAQPWGNYAAAIARWEAVNGPAPEPTEPSKKGKPRLSPAFPEWMMGLPAGWITDVPDITRNEALKAAGNGVVPQQASAALIFLDGIASAS